MDRSLILIGKRLSGDCIQVDPSLLFNNQFEVIETNCTEDLSLKREAISQARTLLQKIQMQRDDYVMKKSVYLRHSFDEQMQTLQNRLRDYQLNNIENKNNALINQTISQIEDLEERSNERLENIERERSIQLQSIKRLAQLVLEPTEQPSGRIIPEDVYDSIKEYEYQHGRLNIQKRKAYGLVDFTSETTADETRFIIVTDSIENLMNTIHHADYLGIEDVTYIYLYENNQIKEEVKLCNGLLMHEF